jgi:hypothetical protein
MLPLLKFLYYLFSILSVFMVAVSDESYNIPFSKLPTKIIRKKQIK